MVKTITAENWGFLVISFFYSLTHSLDFYIVLTMLVFIKGYTFHYEIS